MSSSSAPIHFACTHCGAQLSVDGSTQTPACAYCQTQILLPEAIWRRFHPAPEPSAPQAAATGVRRSGALVIALVVAVVSVVGVVVVRVCIAVVGRVAGTAVVPAPSGPPNPIAMAGEPCNGRRAACSKDEKAQLLCGANDRMTLAQTCKGPNACRATTSGKSVTCDTTLADLNDPCNITDDACSTDRKAELRCQAGHFAVIATCRGPDGCTVTPSKTGSGYTLSCDDHVADVGDPCFDTERTACSSDKKTLLTCTAQRFVVHRACRRGCKVTKVVGTRDTEMDCE
jgi:DNA-directed RNA polymerase subunit RPC12/RpoP